MGNSDSQVPKPPVKEQAQSPKRNKSTVTATVTATATATATASTAVAVPPKFTTKDDFFTTWFSWKYEFLAYLKNIDKAEDKKQMWGIMLLNRMGPVGQEIHRTFLFYDKNAQENIDVLIKKFDIYCIYGDKKRGYEDIDKYINDLIHTAIARNCVNPMDVVKDKIIQDISTRHFTGKAALLIESKGENLIPYLQSLHLGDIILFWKQCEDLMQKIDETPKHDSSSSTSAVIECTRCGTEHYPNRCPAWGARCNKCKQFNHFTDYCRVKFVDDCTKCGLSHIQSHCPAFGELCTKCGKRNHFSLKCQIRFVNNCWRCGTNHVASSAVCPAQNRTNRH